ncbi:hypothetical protein [Veillonella sp. CHU740]|uniref:hypothetical protein n=1 Tax=Veillonella sp. CHU740 TaxID=2490950 RepID=UPI000F8E7970|nr:hypothetical protein [Veillonella sp. CHU740]
MKQLRYYLALALVVGGLSVAQAEANPYSVVRPSDWEYKALMTLVKHGAVTDTKGIELGSRSFTKQELIPLIADVVDTREVMNESDKMLVLRLYSENRRLIMNYDIEKEAEKEAAKEAVKRGRQKEEGKEIGTPIVLRPALSKQEIQKKMDAFTIDTSGLRQQGAVQIHTPQKRKRKRSQLHMVIPSVVASDVNALQPMDTAVQEAMASTKEEPSKKEEIPTT